MVKNLDAVLPENYAELLGILKTQIRDAQHRAQRMVNTQLIQLHWSIGKTILTQQARNGWGSGVAAQLAADLRRDFPRMTGISRTNLFYMRKFALLWPEEPIVQQPVGQLPWGHVTVLLDRLSDSSARDWYASEAVNRGWSRNVLLNHIKNKTLERSGASPSNFDNTHSSFTLTSYVTSSSNSRRANSNPAFQASSVSTSLWSTIGFAGNHTRPPLAFSSAAVATTTPFDTHWEGRTHRSRSPATPMTRSPPKNDLLFRVPRPSLQPSPQPADPSTVLSSESVQSARTIRAAALNSDGGALHVPKRHGRGSG